MQVGGGQLGPLVEGHLQTVPVGHVVEVGEQVEEADESVGRVIGVGDEVDEPTVVAIGDEGAEVVQGRGEPGH